MFTTDLSNTIPEIASSFLLAAFVTPTLLAPVPYDRRKRRFQRTTTSFTQTSTITPHWANAGSSKAKAIVETDINLLSCLSENGDCIMNLVVLCDFDGTITSIDTAEFVLAKFAQGNWQEFDTQFQRGETTLEECMKRQFSLVKASQKQILNELKSVVTFRPNFEKLAEYCREKLVPLVVVSAGLDFVIKHFLKLRNWQELVETYTPKTKLSGNRIEFSFPRLFDRTSANFKHDLVRHYIRQGRKVMYIGDGSGDYAAAKDANYSFAIKSSRLEKLCKNHRMHCQSMTDFQEVVEAIRKMTF